MKATIALIHGGEGYEHDISVLGANNISKMICREKYDVLPVLIDKRGEWLIDGGKTSVFPVLLGGKSGLISDSAFIPIDLAIPLLHGDHGEDGEVLGALKSAHIKFIGCGILPSALTADKISAKLIASSIGIPTADFVFSTDKNCDKIVLQAEKALAYPMFVKPSGLGSSIGISKAHNRKELISAYERALKYSERILIEKAVEVKCELECAYLGVFGKHLYRVGKVISDGKFYDFDKKYLSYTETSADIENEEVAIAVTKAADKLREVIGAGGLARFDFFLANDGTILFNEINTFPGMTKTSLFPALTVGMGFSEGEFINRLIEEALV